MAKSHKRTANTRKIAEYEDNPLRNDSIALFVQGMEVSEIAKSLDISTEIVRCWLNSTNGRAEMLRMQREKNKNQLNQKQELELAHNLLIDSATKAAFTLRDGLGTALTRGQLKSATEILDRVGVTKTERVQITQQNAYDLSKLSDDEAEALEELLEKASKK